MQYESRIQLVVTLMERFVSGLEIGIIHAQALEVALRDISDNDEELDELADMLAQYSPGGGDHLYDYAYAQPRVARQLQRLRAHGDR